VSGRARKVVSGRARKNAQAKNAQTQLRAPQSVCRLRAPAIDRRASLK
jgi:hypothetical protein